MPVDLKNRSDEDTGDSGIHPDWYRPESDPLEDAYNAPSATADDLPAGHPSRGSSVSTPNDLATAESSGATPAATDAERSETPQNEGQQQFKYSNDPADDKTKARVTKKQGIIGTVVVFLGLGVFGGASILQGPFQLLQLSNLLSGTFFSRNDSTSDTSLRRLRNTITGRREQNNLGALSAALANKNLERLATVGIVPEFDTPNGKGRAKIQTFRVDTSTPEGRQFLGRAIQEGFRLPDDFRPGSTIRIDARGGEGGRLGRKLTEELAAIDGKKGLAGKLAQRRLKRLFGVNYHPLNIAKRALESSTDRRLRRKNERAQESLNGRETQSPGNPVNNPEGDTDQNTVRPEDRATAESIGDEIDGISNADPVEARSRLQQLRRSPLFRVGASAAAVVSVLCSAKDMGNSVTEYKMDNVIKPLVRLSMQFVAAGSQIQSMQDVNFEEIGGLAEQLYDEGDEAAGRPPSSVFAAAPLVAATGGTGGVRTDPAVASQISGAYSREIPQLFRVINGIPFLSQACDANDWFGDLPGIRELSDISNQVVSGLSSVATGRSLEDWMGDLVAVLSGGAIDVLAEGAPLGALLGPGSLIAANATAIANGGVELTPPQRAEWNQYLAVQKREEFQSLSLHDRLFDIRRHDSVIGSALLKTAPYTENIQSISTFARSHLSFTPSSIFRLFSNMLTGTTKAQVVHGYDYGIPEYGIPLTVLESERYEDIYENFDRLEENGFAKLRQANESWGHCFGDSLDDTGRIIDSEAAEDEYARLEQCRQYYSDPDFRDYQMYILDNVSIKSMACYEGISEEACGEIGAGGVAPTATTIGDTQGGVNNAAGNDIFVIGDSITEGMTNTGLETKLRNAGWNVVDIQAVTGEQVLTAITNLAPKEAALAGMTGTVVVALGTNDGGSEASFSEKISQMVNTLRRINPGLRIVWVNAYSINDPFNGVNDALLSQSRIHNFTLLDWRAEAQARSVEYEFSSVDGIHHTFNGYSRKADWLVRSLGPTPSGTGQSTSSSGQNTIPIRGAF